MLQKNLMLAVCTLLCAGTASAVRLSDLVDFPVGVAVEASGPRSFLANPEKQSTIKAYFGQLTAGNEMKMSYLHPSENTYSWATADSMVSWAEANDVKMHGHCFIWHSDYQVPAFMKSYTGDFQAMLDDHVTTVAKHFKGKMQSWDVVNEVLDTSTGTCYRDSLFYQKTGKAYIANAFIKAREADPSAQLYYNDYDIEGNTAKMDCLASMLDDLQGNNVPIDGVGFQMHVQIDWPSIDSIKGAFKDAVDRGLMVKITELDVPLNNPYASTPFPQYSSYTAAAAQAQAARYKAIVQAYVDVVPPAKRGGVTIWGIYDGHSWLLDLASRTGVDDWPLLFTGPENGPYQPKEAFYAVQEVLASVGTSPPTTPAPLSSHCRIYAACYTASACCDGTLCYELHTALPFGMCLPSCHGWSCGLL